MGRAYKVRLGDQATRAGDYRGVEPSARGRALYNRLADHRDSARPIWTIALDGFGNHDPGKGRYNGFRPL